MIKVLFFGSLNDEYQSIEKLPNKPNQSVQEVWQMSTKKDSIPEHILIAVNHDYVKKDFIINDNDEVAFFPPVTGG